jgi:hypothetical protein
MANPGPYPPMGPPMGGPMQPMGGPPMGPMGGMPPRQPMRQGTSRLVPVVVSAGLAVGVFCGLLFGLGTGKRNASAETQVSRGGKHVDDSTAAPVDFNAQISDQRAPKAGSRTGSAVAANPGSGSGSSAGSAGSAAAGSAAGSNADSAEPTIKTSKLVVEIKPDTVAQVAKIFVDGKFTTSPTVEVSLDPGTTKKKVKVLVKAVGYKDVEQEIEVEGESTTLKLELIRSGRSSNATAGAEGGGTGRTGGNTATGGNAGGNTGTGGTGGTAGTSGTGGSTGAGGTGGKSGSGKSSGKGKGKGSGLIDI